MLIYYFISGLLFFFLQIRQPPRSTLFPTRRSSDLKIGPDGEMTRGWSRAVHIGPSAGPFKLTEKERSEEHTSELQSHSDLVCRLLLEKKKHIGKPEVTAGVPVSEALMVQAQQDEDG